MAWQTFALLHLCSFVFEVEVEADASGNKNSGRSPVKSLNKR
jgi:hypothetical protein